MGPLKTMLILLPCVTLLRVAAAQNQPCDTSGDTGVTGAKSIDYLYSSSSISRGSTGNSGSSTLSRRSLLQTCSSACQPPKGGGTARCNKGKCVYKCPKGLFLFKGKCNAKGMCQYSCLCGLGQHSKRGQCRTCPRNTYKQALGNDTCTRCPDGRQTAGDSPRLHDNKNDCLPGGLLHNLGNSDPSPRVAEFKQQIQLAKLYSTSLAESLPGTTIGTTDCLINCPIPTTNLQLAAAVAHLAGSHKIYSTLQPLARSLPSRRCIVKDQGSCATCVNYAIATAAEAQVATLLAVAAKGVVLPGEYGYYCDRQLTRSCGMGWTFEDAFQALQDFPTLYFINNTCLLGQDLAHAREAGQGQIQAACAAVANCAKNRALLQGCTVRPLDGFAEMQQAIRNNGGVITRIVMNANMIDFFQENPKGIFRGNGNDTADDASGFNHAVVLVGYDNVKQAWLLQNSYGSSFGNKGFFWIGYGALGVAAPGLSYVMDCVLSSRVDDSSAAANRWPLEQDQNATSCYWYKATAADTVSVITDHFKVDILQFIQDNIALGVFDWTDIQRTRPDLSTPLSGKRLHVCNITADFTQVGALSCPRGEQQNGAQCLPCPDDSIKIEAGAGRCSPCPEGTRTPGSYGNSSDHDELADCKPVTGPLLQLCEQFIGVTNVSGVYNVTLRGKQYQVYCDMETDGGGWTLVMNYNHGPNTNPVIRFRSLADGFPLDTGNPIGVDESSNTKAWGHMDPAALTVVPEITEARVLLQAYIPEKITTHVKYADPGTLAYIKTGAVGNFIGIRTNAWLSSGTELVGHNVWAFQDGQGYYHNALFWPAAPVPSRLQLYIRGPSTEPQDCPPGTFAVGYGCHTCPDHTFKAGSGPQACTLCGPGEIATTRDANFMSRDPASFTACQPGTPDRTVNLTQRSAKWELYPTVRAGFSKAEAICISRGGHLVTLSSTLDQDTMWDEVRGYAAQDIPNRYSNWWIGLYNNGTDLENGWKWTSGAPVTFTRWYEDRHGSQPDNYQGEQGKYACMSEAYLSYWDDPNRDSAMRFVCEIPA